MNQEQYFAAYKGRKIVIYPTASLPMCRFTLKSPAEIPFDIGDTFGLDVIGAGSLAFVGDKDDLWCIVPKMDKYKIPPANVFCHRKVAQYKSCPDNKMPDNILYYFIPMNALNVQPSPEHKEAWDWLTDHTLGIVS